MNQPKSKARGVRKKQKGIPWHGEAPETVTKLEAARRQADVAIDLYFGGGDIVSMHSLAENAREVLTKLGASFGAESVLDGRLRERAALGEGEWLERFGVPRNFAKHSAPTEASQTCDYYPGQTSSILLDVCLLHQSVAGWVSSRMVAFSHWRKASARDGDFPEPALREELERVRAIVGGRDRATFYREFVVALEESARLAMAKGGRPIKE